MLGFWETRMRDKMVFRLVLAPFLGGAAALLLEASRLWHPWGKGRADELVQWGRTLDDRANHIRRCGMGWAGNISELGGDAAGLLSSYSHYRYYANGEHANCPEAVPYLIASARELISWCVPAFRNIEARDSMERGWADWLERMIEKLLESPCADGAPAISGEAFKILGYAAVLSECEGLTYAQACIEDSYAEFDRMPRKRKKTELSDAEVRKLAHEIGMDFESVKEALESEFSPWWEESGRYGREAEKQFGAFAGLLSASSSVTRAIREAWDPGTPHHNASFKCYGAGTLATCEAVMRALIAQFLSYKDIAGFGEAPDCRKALPEAPSSRSLLLRTP